MHTTDIFVQSSMSSIRTPFLTQCMEFVTGFFDVSILFVSLVVVTAILVYILLGKKRSISFLLTLFAGLVLVFVIKYAFNISRPEDSLVKVLSPSFPSAHSAGATIFFLMVMHYFDGFMSGFWRHIFNSFCITSLLLVAFSRLYLGVHWLSDVFGGIFLGVIVSYVSIHFFESRKK